MQVAYGPVGRSAASLLLTLDTYMRVSRLLSVVPSPSPSPSSVLQIAFPTPLGPPTPANGALYPHLPQPIPSVSPSRILFPHRFPPCIICPCFIHIPLPRFQSTASLPTSSRMRKRGDKIDPGSNVTVELCLLSAGEPGELCISS